MHGLGWVDQSQDWSTQCEHLAARASRSTPAVQGLLHCASAQAGWGSLFLAGGEARRRGSRQAGRLRRPPALQDQHQRRSRTSAACVA